MKSISIPIKLEEIYKQRSSRRLPYKDEIEIISSTGEYCKGNIMNISQTGMCITTDSELVVGSQILSRISVDSEICELDGKVSWINKNHQDNTFKMGVDLEKIPDDYKDIYQRIIRKLNNPHTDKQSGTRVESLIF